MRSKALSVAFLVGAFGCGGRASEDSRGDTAGAPSGSNASGSTSGASGTINGICPNCMYGLGGAGGYTAGSLNVLLACAPSGGAQPPALCTSDVVVGAPCYTTAFPLCSTSDYSATIVCGLPGSCIPPADSGSYDSANPCVGACATAGAICQWGVNLSGGGVSTYMCCSDAGRLTWLLGDCSSR
jgi:hypothetical protein